MLFEIVYDYSDEYTTETNIHEKIYCESWGELSVVMRQMRKDGCYNIAAMCIDIM